MLSRYARLFRLSPNQTRQALAQIHLMKLPQDDFLRVHYVKNSEQIGYRLRRVRKGTLVFAFSDGTPIMAQVCGNPLQSQLRMPAMMVPPTQTMQIADFRPEEPLDMKPSPMPFDMHVPNIATLTVLPQIILEEPTPVVAGEIKIAPASGETEIEASLSPANSVGRAGFPAGNGTSSLPLSPLLAGLLPSLFSRRSTESGNTTDTPLSDFVPVVAPVASNSSTVTDSLLPSPSIVTPEQSVKDWAMGGNSASAPGAGGGGGSGASMGSGAGNFPSLGEIGTATGNPSNPFDSQGNSPLAGGTALTINSVPELGNVAMIFGYLVAASSIVSFFRLNKKR